MYFVLLYGGKNQFPVKYVYGVPIYKYVVESLSNAHPKRILVIVSEESKHMPFTLAKLYPEHEWFHAILPFNTRGAAESVYQGLSAFFTNNQTTFKMDEPFWILDNDVVYDPNTPWEVLQPIEHSKQSLYLLGTQAFLPSQHPNTPSQSCYSHIITDPKEPSKVVNIIEKENKSPLVLMGGYGIPSFNIFQTMYQSMLNTFNNQDFFMSEIVRYALRNDINVRVTKVSNTFTMGSQHQIKDAMNRGLLFPRPLRWVFDLDDTLVSQPQISGDYSTCLPIQEICDFVKYLKSKDHYIIIHTARHMKTCNGDLKLIEDKVGKTTRDFLGAYDIPYDELLFGKPFADIYVDDKAFHPFGIFPNKNLMNEGIDELFLDSIQAKIHKISEDLCYKYDNATNLSGYTYFVRHAPKPVRAFLPELYHTEPHRILMRWIDGITVGQLYTNNILEKRIFQKVLEMVKVLHDQITDEALPITTQSVMQNYWIKLEKRINEHSQHYKKLTFIKPEDYAPKIRHFFEYYKPQIVSCIHGDFWFSNMIWHHREQKLYMIDMRGRLGDEPCLGGDAMYDLAKMYQSIAGFDFLIQKGTLPPKEYRETFERMFIDYLNLYLKVSLQDVRKVAFTLMYGSLPFHKEIHSNPDTLKHYEELLLSLW